MGHPSVLVKLGLGHPGIRRLISAVDQFMSEKTLDHGAQNTNQRLSPSDFMPKGSHGIPKGSVNILCPRASNLVCPGVAGVDTLVC